MRMYPGRFPAIRAAMPERRAEQRTYEALTNSARQGFVFYEWRRDYHRIEVDFALWVEDLARFALQVKGGYYRLVDGEWQLSTRSGWKHIETSPLDEAWLGALDIHDDIEELAETPYNPFVIPAISFPDMEPDEAIVRLARRNAVYPLWRNRGLIQSLEEVVRKRGAPVSLDADRIAREVRAVTDGLIRLDGSGGEDVAEGENTSGLIRLDRAGGNDIVEDGEDSSVIAHPPGPFRLSLSAGGLDILRVAGRVKRLRWRTVVNP